MCARYGRTVLKRQLLMFYPLRKNSQQPYGAGVGVGGIQSPPLYVRGLNNPRKKPALIIVGKTDCQKEN